MQVEWWGTLPFVVMLLSIAIVPLVPKLAGWWSHPRAQLTVALALGLPVALWVMVAGHSHLVGHALQEYLGFICLIGSLFVITGGIHLAGDIRATPRNNTLFLAIGALIASVVGTTGAAMLLIRPILNTNKEREHASHTIVYAIFLVANCGGLLTPLGDPPLFLGLMRGVPFTWTLTLLPQWAFVNGLLLASYYCLDRAMFAREDAPHRLQDQTDITPLKLLGTHNFVWLAGVVAAVAVVPSPWRDVVVVGCALGSWLTTSHEVRHTLNEFSWAPIAEVAAIFLGIFTTMVPALQYLDEIAPKFPLDEITFFLFSGGLSSVLDNAPTYATFFELASHLPGDPRVAGVPEAYLIAISLGAVCCGAMTYIGNGPNFMVRSVAEQHGRPMPSFGGYIVWSVRELAPVLAAMVLLFIADATWAKALGAVVTVGIIVVALYRARGTSHVRDAV